jgi:hypothetical protein
MIEINPEKAYYLCKNGCFLTDPLPTDEIIGIIYQLKSEWRYVVGSTPTENDKSCKYVDESIDCLMALLK